MRDGGRAGFGVRSALRRRRGDDAAGAAPAGLSLEGVVRDGRDGGVRRAQLGVGEAALEHDDLVGATGVGGQARVAAVLAALRV